LLGRKKDKPPQKGRRELAPRNPPVQRRMLIDDLRLRPPTKKKKGREEKRKERVNTSNVTSSSAGNWPGGEKKRREGGRRERWDRKRATISMVRGGRKGKKECDCRAMGESKKKRGEEKRERFTPCTYNHTEKPRHQIPILREREEKRKHTDPAAAQPRHGRAIRFAHPYLL